MHRFAPAQPDRRPPSEPAPAAIRTAGSARRAVRIARALAAALAAAMVASAALSAFAPRACTAQPLPALDPELLKALGAQGLDAEVLKSLDPETLEALKALQSQFAPGTAATLPPAPQQPTATHGVATAPGVLAAPASDESLQVQMRDDQVWMQAREVPLRQALSALAGAAGFELKVNDDFAEPVSIRLQGVPVTDAIRRLTRHHSSVMLFETDATGERRVAELRVYRATQGQAPIASTHGAANRTAPLANRATSPGNALDPARLAELARLLNDGSDTRQQRQAITELRGLGGDAAVEALSSALTLPDKTVRSYAVAVLGQIGSPRAVELLGRSALADEEPDVRIRAVIALARQHGDQAREYVEAAATRDSDERVREAAEARLSAW